MKPKILFSHPLDNIQQNSNGGCDGDCACSFPIVTPSLEGVSAEYGIGYEGEVFSVKHSLKGKILGALPGKDIPCPLTVIPPRL